MPLHEIGKIMSILHSLSPSYPLSLSLSLSC